MVETGGMSNFIIFFPLLVFGFGIVFLWVAAKDQRGRPGPRVRSFTERSKHPLRHVQVGLTATRKAARDAHREPEPKPEPKPERKRRSGPPFLRGL